MNKTWYVLQVMTGKETEVRSKLLKEFESYHEDRQPKALVPRRKMIERKNGQVRQIVRTLFPSYVFLQIELNDSVYYKIKQIPYLIRILGNGRPEPVPLQQMKPILKLCELDELIDISKVALGNTIEIVDGPLKGFAGNIVRIDRRKKRVRVRFCILDEIKEIDLGIEFITK